MEILIVGAATVALLWLWNRADERGVRVPFLSWFDGAPSRMLVALFVATWAFAIALLVLDMTGAGEIVAFTIAGLVAVAIAAAAYRVMRWADQDQRQDSD